MKKLLMIPIVAILLLSGCSSAASVDTMKGWSFQYNEGTDDYSLFFGLCDSNDNFRSADANVDIKIVNDNDEVVYEGTKSVTKNDFGNYTSQTAGDRYLADVRIEKDEIKEGSSSNGTIYFTVTSDYFSFDECSCDVYACLPTAAVTVNVGEFPIELSQKGVWGSVESKFSITDVSYQYDGGYGYPSLTFTISGEKTYGTNDSLNYDIISYKLYDSEEYLVDSGQAYLGTNLSVGDKFKDDSLVIYDVTAGENYTLQLLDYEY